MANSFWNIYNYRLPLLRTFKSNGWKIIIIAVEDEYLKSINKSLYDEVCCLQNLKPKSVSLIQDLKFLYECKKLLKSIKTDILLTFTIKPNIWGSIASKNLLPIVIPTVTGLGSTTIRENWLSHAVKWLYKYALISSAHVLFHNIDDRSLFVKRGLVAESRSGVVNGSGVDTVHFHSQSMDDHTPFTFLFLGRLIKEKGIIEYLKSAGELIDRGCDFKFLIVGDKVSSAEGGLEQKQFEYLIKHEQIDYLGSTNEVRSVIEMCDCLVLPSYREGMPKAILEAMSMRRLVIASDVPGCRHSISDGENGKLFSFDESDNLVLAMLDMASLPVGEKFEMRIKARERVIAFYDQELISEDYRRLVDKLLTERLS